MDNSWSSGRYGLELDDLQCSFQLKPFSDRNVEDKEETEISKTHCLLYVSISFPKCHFSKASCQEELLLFKWKCCCMDTRAEKYFILNIFAMGIGKHIDLCDIMS